MEQVAITGVGVVSPFGVGLEALRCGFAAGGNCFGDLTLFEPRGGCEHAGEAPPDYDWKQAALSKQTYADRCTQLAVGAARLALEQAGAALPVGESWPETGVCFGTRWGCLESAAKFHEAIAAGKGRTASSLVFSHSYPNCPTSFVAIEFGLRGYSTSFSGFADAGREAFASAAAAVRRGAPRMLAGAADALNETVFRSLERSGVLPDTRGKSPADADAGWGAVPVEAAAFFVLEPAAVVAARGAKPLGFASDLPAAEAKLRETAWRFGDAGAAGSLLLLAAAI